MKRNKLIFSSVLGGRLVGFEGQSLYRARDSLKTPLRTDPSVSQFKAMASDDGSYQQRGGKAVVDTEDIVLLQLYLLTANRFYHIESLVTAALSVQNTQTRFLQPITKFG